MQFIGSAINVLSSVAGDKGEIERLAASAGVDPSRIDWSGSAKLVWYRVLQEASKVRRVDLLLQAVYDEYPTDAVHYIVMLHKDKKEVS